MTFASLRAALFVFSVSMVTALALPDPEIADAVHVFEIGDYGRALQLLSEKSRSNPRSAQTRFWLGRVQSKLRSWDEAVRELEQAVSIEPSNGLYRLWLARAYGDKASHVSLFSAMGWARKVGKEFETAQRLAPTDLDVRFDLLQFYLQAPGIVGGGRDKAESQARAIAGLNPMAGYGARAEIYRHDKKWDLARNELLQATEKYPDQPSGYVDLAEFLLERGDFAGAEANAGRALQMKPRYPKAELIRAAAEIELHKDIPTATRILKALSGGPLREPDPSFQQVHYWLGRAYEAAGDFQSAVQAYQNALQFDPEYSAAKSALSKLRRS